MQLSNTENGQILSLLCIFYIKSNKNEVRVNLKLNLSVSLRILAFLQKFCGYLFLRIFRIKTLFYLCLFLQI